MRAGAIETAVVMERPLTLFLNGREIVTMMTIGDHPDYLAVGYLLNQNMLRPDGPDHRHRLRRRARDRRRPHRSRDRFRGQAEEEDADLRLRPGHRLRRPDGEVRGGPARPRGGAAHLLALCADPQDQHRAEPLSRRRGDPRLRLVRGGPAAPLHGGCRPAQRDRQDRRLHAPAPHLPRPARSSTPPGGSPPRW